MVDDFKVEPIYEDRTYERHRFNLSIDGKDYEGNFHEGKIQWLHPHPKQDLEDDHLKWIEEEIYRLLSENEVVEDLDGIEVEPMFENQAHEAHLFKLNIEGEEFKGLIRNGHLEWFHPKPRRKIKDVHVEKAEKKVHEKIKMELEDRET
ncbi:HicA family toxin-antitoxin system [Lederbergia panacisoli]|uniref:HicA family toxin-antitoxin system n=1 Tax=Lederbergia panacisoli TaxID=1255251 RepID=UPI00214AF575|nr:HicA family toxin-antitoxin system [Lederbergia panacisoli]MCR2821583.1 HicA family toxin-antitoxin system [Lederbergia panacisoli]